MRHPTKIEVLRSQPSAEAIGPSVLLKLQEAARLRQSCEVAARADVEQARATLHKLEEKVAVMEVRAQEAEARAREAETWMVKIGETVKEMLLDPLIAREHDDSQ